MTHPQLAEILSKLRSRLEATYKERLVSLLLFCSQARKEATADSDIDVLVVLDGDLDVPKYQARRSHCVSGVIC
jgi:predicted nucleotidyltransferase